MNNLAVLLFLLNTHFLDCSAAACQYVFFSQRREEEPPACSNICCCLLLANLSLAVPIPLTKASVNRFLTSVDLDDIAVIPLTWLVKFRFPLYSKHATHKSKTFNRRFNLYRIRGCSIIERSKSLSCSI